MSTRRADFDAMRAKFDMDPMTDDEYADMLYITHLRVAENLPLCEKAEGRKCWGEWLDDDPAEVGCPTCLEWMHA